MSDPNHKKRKPRQQQLTGAFLYPHAEQCEGTLKKHTPKSHVGVTGKMSEEDAGKVGQKLANAALIFAIGMAVAAIIAAVKWW